MAGIKFEIQENLGVISESANGWTKELNLVSWNDRPAKFDIRDWDENHQKMGKGLTLSIDELRELKKVLNEMNL
ncbi:PC4/YdbC family ssDNA-binding protein [Paraclostridium ghonii]|uniref:YdbC family protein n=1 Tax=Paraclostridium ghonii TaxID=29358 RepID=UPI003525DEFF